MAFTLCLKDRFGDVHAARCAGEANPEAIESAAREIADEVACCDPDENVRVGLCLLRDVGAARLGDGRDYADGGIEWLYTARVSELKREAL
jgi:hypothetical protein